MSKETESKVKEYQAALNILKPNDHDVIHHEDGWWNWQNDAVTSIQELVDIYPEYLELKEKATPKKPKLHIRRSKLEKIIGKKDVYACPRCGNSMLFKDANERQLNNYCWDCGQLIDWSKDDERPLFKPQVIIHNHQAPTLPIPIIKKNEETKDKKPMHKVIVYTWRYDNIEDTIRKLARENVEVVVIYNDPRIK